MCGEGFIRHLQKKQQVGGGIRGDLGIYIGIPSQPVSASTSSSFKSPAHGVSEGVKREVTDT